MRYKTVQHTEFSIEVKLVAIYIAEVCDEWHYLLTFPPLLLGFLVELVENMMKCQMIWLLAFASQSYASFFTVLWKKNGDVFKLYKDLYIFFDFGRSPCGHFE